jgi:hypothetical protein
MHLTSQIGEMREEISGNILISGDDVDVSKRGCPLGSCTTCLLDPIAMSPESDGRHFDFSGEGATIHLGLLKTIIFVN